MRAFEPGYLVARRCLTAWACLLIAAATTPAMAQASPDSAEWIMPGCQAFLSDGKGEPFKQGVCLGMTAAVSEMAGICVPVGTTHEQSVRTVVRYIEARPAQAHKRFIQLAREALAAAWPCDKA